MGFCKSDGDIHAVVCYVVLSGGDHDVGHGDDDGDRAGTQSGRQLGYQLHHQLLLGSPLFATSSTSPFLPLLSPFFTFSILRCFSFFLSNFIINILV